ncbi:MAG: thiolase family protein [Lactobacillus sp.]|nr:thiolase family protein [Lactobacillus sp.]
MDKIYIVGYGRTPFGNYKGQLAHYSAVDLGQKALVGTLEKSKIDAKIVDALYLGNVYGAGLGQNIARQISIKSGMREDSYATTINEVCGSSLKAVRLAMGSILMGDAEVIAVGGAESMTNAAYVTDKEMTFKKSTLFQDGLIDAFSGDLMGLTAERVIKEKHVDKTEFEEFAVESHHKAAKSRDLLAKEIIPLPELDHDENVKADTSLEAIRELKPAFDGDITAATASPLSDGSSMVIIASETAVKKYNLEVLCQIKAYAETGFNPAQMGYGPKVSIEKLLNKEAETVADIDFFEINEAFSPTTVAVYRDLAIPKSKVNQWGGALSIGHPLGASGTRLVGTAVNQLLTLDQHKAIVSICIGGGLAISMELVR